MASERLAETIDTLHRIIEPVLDREGFELIELEYKRTGAKRARYLLRLTVDRAGRTSYDPVREDDGSGRPVPTGGVTVTDCVALTKALGPLLDVEDVVPGAYHLEVSSPGVNRPLKKPQHFALAVGRRVRVKTRVPVGDDSFFVAPLVASDDEGLTLDVRGDEVRIPYRLVAKANLEFEF